MKFGEQLRSSAIREYQWYYIDYDGLKADLKHPSGPVVRGGDDDAKPGKPPRREWTEEDESRFVSKLEAELDKVHTKQQVKAMEISRRIAVTEREVRDVVNRLNERGLGQEGPSEEEFMLLEEDLSDIIADVHDLAKFVQLNYTGFYKIIKKHDKMTGWHLRPVFDTRLKAKPFYKENYDASVVKLSKLYDIVRTRGNPVKGDSAAGGSQANFVRHTTKYWVHPDNVTELKLIILKHLPVLVFNASKEFEEQDSAISSIYYDNPNTWELYEGRLKKTEGAEAIRLRWYGGMQNETIFVERKTHREDWTGEKSVKARFSLKEKNVNAYMRGELLPAAIFEKARKEGKKSEKAIAEDERLAREIQWSVLKKGYKPVCRSFYHRTAFQLPADARVRISLDTELAMIREDNLDGKKRSGDNWRRMDIGIDYPFSQLPPGDIVRFPYAVLEVKLQTQLGQEPPEWVRQLTSSHLVEAVPKFSKFIHGVASLFPDRIKLLPYWMPQMDVDIRKPVTHDFGIKRLEHSATTSVSEDEEDDDDYDSDDDHRPVTADAGQAGESSTSAARNGRAQGSVSAADIEDQTVDRPLVDEDTYLYDSEDEEDEEDRLEAARRVGGWTYYRTRASTSLNAAARGMWWLLRALVPRPRATEVPRSARLESLLGPGEIQHRRFKAPKGKKIYVPVRVEPKVYFAAERTFLGWLEYSIYIGTIAVTLLNFGTEQGNKASFVAAGAFTVLALLSLCYSVVIYLYRSKAIRERRVARYYDKVGPSVLCVALFVAINTELGHSLPPEAPHNITFHIPGWDTAKALRRGDPELLGKLASIYPRFGPWCEVREVTTYPNLETNLSSYKQDPDTLPTAVAFASSSHRQKNGVDNRIAPRDLLFRAVDIPLTLPLPSEPQGDATFDGEIVRLFAIAYPLARAPGAVGVWQNYGTGISSRLAAALLPAGRFLPLGEGHEMLRRRIAGLVVNGGWAAAAAADGGSGKVTEADVWLYPTGMAAIYRLHRALVEARGPGTVVVLGSVFHNTWHLAEENPGGMKHYGRCDPDSGVMEALEVWLEGEKVAGRKVAYIFAEFPSNPILVSVDLKRLREVANKYSVPVVIDDTIGSFCNIDVSSAADAIVTSITKSVSGYANVMGGSVVITPTSTHHSLLKSTLDAQFRNEYFHADAIKLLSNSQSYVARSRILNRNALALATYLDDYRRRQSPSSTSSSIVAAVLYPPFTPTAANYAAMMRQPPTTATADGGEPFTPGHGCLLAVEFSSLRVARAFYDNLSVYHGPHLGAHHTLAFPFNDAIWGTDPEGAAYLRTYGAKAEQVRVSVGLEDEQELIDTFVAALEVAEKVRDEEESEERAKN
ncbi:vacuolar transporter chaperone 4 [Corynascus novoguineensis]|uniref:Vacuolar transporter chaperone complex subunit 4 n=1 Tax=Corynascus novoguineensis TaxID=1126955 RepID=A0AAN7CUV9_9PEZI|nr:vacuolar transporter chaperone 4 [Corynascus novoguineensis]